MSQCILSVRQLKKYFPVRIGLLGKAVPLKAVDGVSLGVKPGSVFGLVGESGCGKTTLIRVMLRLERPTAGQVLFGERDVFSLRGADLKSFRAAVQIVFQDPYWSLNPRWNVGQLISEPLLSHSRLRGKALQYKVGELLNAVGLESAQAGSYGHELSAGERQRVAIARALALDPALVFLDEPTSALDTFSQAQILNLLKDLKVQKGLSYWIISHDLSVVLFLADEIAVMYMGKVMEHGPIDEVYANPRHPYTQALMAAIPDIEQSYTTRKLLKGELPSAIYLPQGCRFSTRCPDKLPVCDSEPPPEIEVGKAHTVACHLMK